MTCDYPTIIANDQFVAAAGHHGRRTAPCLGRSRGSLVCEEETHKQQLVYVPRQKMQFQIMLTTHSIKTAHTAKPTPPGASSSIVALASLWEKKKRSLDTCCLLLAHTNPSVGEQREGVHVKWVVSVTGNSIGLKEEEEVEEEEARLTS